MVQKIFILLRIMVPDLKDWNWLENVTAELWRHGVNIHTLMWWTIELILRPRYDTLLF